MVIHDKNNKVKSPSQKGQGTIIKMGDRTNKENSRPLFNKGGHSKVGIQTLHPQDQGVPTRWGDNHFYPQD